MTAVLDDGRPARTHTTDDGTLSVELPKGREVLLYVGERPDLVIAPVSPSETGEPWGLP